MRRLIVTLLLAVSAVSQAQTRDILKLLNDTISHVPYVFEGRVEAVEVFAGDDKGNRLPKSAARWDGGMAHFYDSQGHEAKGYSSATITVCREYKGDLPEKIVMVTKASSLDNLYLVAGKDTAIQFLNAPPSHGYPGVPMMLPHPSYPISKLFFVDRYTDARQTTYAGKEYYANMNIVMDAPMNVQTLKEKSDGSAKSVQAYAIIHPHVFDNQEQLSEFLGQINGLNPNPKCYCSSQMGAKKKEPVREYFDYSQNRANYEKWFGNLEERAKLAAQNRANLSNPKGRRPTNNLTLSMGGARIVRIASDDWYEYEIYISSNNVLFFDNAVMRIGYNTNVFGTSVIANSNITVTNGPNFSGATYNSVQAVMYENTSSQISLPIGAGTVSNPNRVLVGPTAQLLMTVRIKIITCAQPVNLVFEDQVNMVMFAMFTPAANTAWQNSVGYDNCGFSAGITDVACLPIIAAFTNGVPGGIGSVLTIGGKYFGTTKEALSCVVFKNADKGNRYPAQSGTNMGGSQVFDIISWKDDEIKIRMPNIIDSAFVFDIIGGVPVLSGPRTIVPGSGLFKIRNSTGTSAESGGPVDIPYTVTQYPFQNPYDKIVPLLSRNTSLSGYRVQLHDNMATTFGASVKSTIWKSMKEWTCATGISWELGPDTTITPQADKWCTIFANPNESGIMNTKCNIWACQNGGNIIHYQRGFDIGIKTSPTSGTWNFDTIGAIANGELDFFSAIGHELGHAHQVGHINDSIVDLMWWQALPFGFSFNARKFIRPSGMARTAGEWMIDNRTSTFNCAGTHVQTSSQNCEEFYTGLHGNLVEKKTLLYPNPSAGRFFIGRDVGERLLRVHDVTGRLVIEQRIRGDDSFDIPNKGIYIVSLETGQTKTVTKVIVE